MDVKELVSRMTLEEKAGMCSGLDFWHTKPVDRLGIPSVMVTDGPHGLRKQADEGDHLGIIDSVVAVCFPAASATACSFDRNLLRDMGVLLGKECQAEKVSVLLGPAVNIKRSPLCGRNFEYISEDPYLAGELAASYINGVQSQNIGTSIKHFAVNNQEHERMAGSSELDERTLREIYLPAFETAVKKSDPWTVMCSYNRVNGVFASENKKLLNDILKEEWGFNGFVVSDWGAVSDRLAGLLAGMELEMPGSNGVNDSLIVEAVRNGVIEESVLDTAVERILNVVYRYEENKRDVNFDRSADHEKTVEIAKQCIVLLQNDGILPLKEKKDSIAIIGGFAEHPRYQGGGSSHITSYKVPSILEVAREYGDFTYAKGFSHLEDKIDKDLFEEALKAAKLSEKVIIFAGLPDSFESEGYDRTHMRLPECQNQLIEEIVKLNRNVIVVLQNGSPVELPWGSRVNAIVEAYLGGEGIAQAVVEVLFGKANPSGKLAESFPIKLEDNPSFLNFPGVDKMVEYKEGVFVGYRYYDSKKMEVSFPFGHGLSYTEFEISEIKVNKREINESEEITVTVQVANVGSVAGKEVVQLYVRDNTGATIRWYNESISDWYVATGDYSILIGNSSRNISVTETIHVISQTKLPFVVDKDTMLGELMSNAKTHEYLNENLLSHMGALNEMENSEMAGMMEAMIKYTPLRSLRSFGNVTNEVIEKIVGDLNNLLKD
ncbi:MAG: glycosyl hydrolase [Anaerocolumna sp.]|nr:glycosyl hydrolase [Anaerocolumna sp.]